MDKPKIIDQVNTKADSLINKANGTLNLLDDILISLKEIKETLNRIDNVDSDKEVVVVEKPKSKSWFY